MNTGIQLYSVSGEFKRDPAAALKSLANMGYGGIEFAFTFGSMSPGELASFLEGIKMEAVGVYSSRVENLLNPDDDIYLYGKHLKIPYITVGNEFLVEDWTAAVTKVREAASVAEKEGFKLLYHNHTAEIKPIEGRPALSILADRTDANLVGLELDTHFIANAGEDPLEWLENYRGRVPLLHVKDIKKDGSVAEVGEGVLDMPAICRKARETGVKWLIVEFHQINERSPMESARICMENLRRFLP